MKQLNLGYKHTMRNTEKAEINVVRLSLRIPLELSIKMDMAMAEQKNLNKNRWIINAIEEKLGVPSVANDSLKSLEQKVEELTQLILKK